MFDLVAVWRASPEPNGQGAEMRRRVGAFVRGGAPSEEELAAVQPNLHAGDISSLRDVSTMVLREMGRTPAIILDVGVDGIDVAELGYDEVGQPRFTGELLRQTWDVLFPALPSDPDERVLTLAGGVGNAGVVIDDDEIDLVAADPSILPRPGAPGRIVVLDRLPGRWSLPGRLLRRYTSVGGRIHAWASLGPAGPKLGRQLVEELASLATLQVAYGLVVVEVDAISRMTRPGLLPIFPAGTSAGARRIVHFTAPATRGREVVLAVVASPAGAPPVACPPVAVATSRMIPSQRTAIELEFDRPGHVRVVTPVSAADAGGLDWQGLLASTPARHSDLTLALDAAFVVEVGGPPAAARRRIALVEEAVQHIRDHHPEIDAVRISIVAYDDHDAPDGPLRVCGFGGADTALSFVASLSPGVVGSPVYAPVEDALRVVCSGGLKWRRGPGARAVAVIGSRRPHPADRHVLHRCPDGINWVTQLEKLDPAGLRRLAVWDPPDWADLQTQRAGAARKEWRGLAGEARLALAHTDGASLARALRALPPPDPYPPVLFPIVESAPDGRGRRSTRE